jgi:Flp pilus assembly pilin Flp
MFISLWGVSPPQPADDQIARSRVGGEETGDRRQELASEDRSQRSEDRSQRSEVRRKRRGVTSLEYLAVTSFILIALILAVQHLGIVTGGLFTNSVNATSTASKSGP